MRASSSVQGLMLDARCSMAGGSGPTADEDNWAMPFFDIFVKTLHITRSSERSKIPTSIWLASKCLQLWKQLCSKFDEKV
jgi:hypothetical protein